MNWLLFLSSFLFGTAVCFGALYVGAILRKLEGEHAAQVGAASDGAGKGFPENITFFRVLIRQRMVSQKRILPKRWKGTIEHEWRRSGMPQRDAIRFVAKLEFYGFLMLGILILTLIVVRNVPFAFLAMISVALLAVQEYLRFKGRVAERLRTIQRELPYALDLLSMMLAGGGNIFNSLEVLSQIRSDSPLMHELRIVTGSLYAGKSFVEALRSFADRVELETVKSIVLAIEQGERLGTPLHKILKSHATTIRNKRILAAEEHAQKAGTKVFIPASLIMLALTIVLLAPSIIKMFGAM